MANDINQEITDLPAAAARAKAIRERIAVLQDDWEDLAKASREFPNDLQGADFDPGPKTMSAATTLAEATPDKVLAAWYEAAAALEREVQEVQKDVGEAVDRHGVAGNAEKLRAS